MRAQKNGKDRADPRRAFDLEKTAMAIEDVFDDRQAEPGAAHFTRAGRVDAVEPLGQSWQVLARDALAVIAHGDRYEWDRYEWDRANFALPEGPRHSFGADRDLGAGPAVFDGIIDQVL